MQSVHVFGQWIAFGAYLSSGGIISGVPTLVTYGQGFSVTISGAVHYQSEIVDCGCANSGRSTSDHHEHDPRHHVGISVDPSLALLRVGVCLPINSPLILHLVAGEFRSPALVVAVPILWQQSRSLSCYLWTTARTGGTFNLIVNVTDSAGNSAARSFSWASRSGRFFIQRFCWRWATACHQFFVLAICSDFGGKRLTRRARPIFLRTNNQQQWNGFPGHLLSLEWLASDLRSVIPLCLRILIEHATLVSVGSTSACR
jgi:hypothetical protein